MMMKNWRHILLATTVSLAAVVAASPVLAADDLLDAPEVTISAAENSESGFYVRGDVGYAPWSDEGNPSLQFTSPAPTGVAAGAFDIARFGNQLSGDIGIGYQFNDMFRADVTADYFEGHFTGRGIMPTSCGAPEVSVACGMTARANYEAIGLMANAYVDLATLAGFTPYVGAGVGSTWLNWDTTRVGGTCVGGPCNGSSSIYYIEGDSSWRFTYAVMAGVSYDVSDRLKLDFGYRYSDIAGGDIYRVNRGAASDDGLARHEFRAGLRFSLW